MTVVLAACGDDDAGKAKSQAAPSAPAAPAATSSPGPAESESTMSAEMAADSSVMAIEDNGVVYEDEIYKNWPEPGSN